MTKIAVVCANGFGDALLSMIVSHNLQLSGFEVVTFSTPLCGLKEWFPSHTILPFSELNSLSNFDQIISADHSLISGDSQQNLIILKENAFDKSKTLVENLQRVCQQRLALPHFGKDNGIVIPPSLKWRSHPKRVIIHPMSTDPKRTWPADKFIDLGIKLEKQGFIPYFCLSPEERAAWLNLTKEEHLPLFSKLSDLAAFVYESDAMIGNNSGIGHMASLFNIPTVSLFARESYARLWRPGWGPGIVVAPPSLLPGSRLRQKYWKQLLSVRRVISSFKKMRVER